jgi:hypothetical protein
MFPLIALRILSIVKREVPFIIVCWVLDSWNERVEWEE